MVGTIEIVRTSLLNPLLHDSSGHRLGRRDDISNSQSSCTFHVASQSRKADTRLSIRT